MLLQYVHFGGNSTIRKKPVCVCITLLLPLWGWPVFFLLFLIIFSPPPPSRSVMCSNQMVSLCVCMMAPFVGFVALHSTLVTVTRWMYIRISIENVVESSDSLLDKIWNSTTTFQEISTYSAQPLNSFPCVLFAYSVTFCGDVPMHGFHYVLCVKKGGARYHLLI